MRAVAREAGVDPALVHHYFDGKSDLFFHAIIGDIENEGEGRINPAAIVRSITAGPPDELGYRWTVGFLRLWDRPGAADRLVSMIGAVASGDEVREPVMQFLQEEVFTPIVAQVAPDRPELRSQLAASHVIGLAITRYVARLPHIVAMTAEELSAFTSGNLQHYLTGDLGAGSTS